MVYEFIVTWCYYIGALLGLYTPIKVTARSLTGTQCTFLIYGIISVSNFKQKIYAKHTWAKESYGKAISEGKKIRMRVIYKAKRLCSSDGNDDHKIIQKDTWKKDLEVHDVAIIFGIPV